MQSADFQVIRTPQGSGIVVRCQRIRIDSNYNVVTLTGVGVDFEWDRRKASGNQSKHGVSFVEATSAFLDENARVIPDPEHSDDEDRFVLLGLSAQAIRRVPVMKKNYDFSTSKRNPHARKAKKQLTIRLDEDTIDYFRELAEESGVPYQSLINLYLRDCAQNRKKLRMDWTA